jgi:hypothetical protein
LLDSDFHCIRFPGLKGHICDGDGQLRDAAVTDDMKTGQANATIVIEPSSVSSSRSPLWIVTQEPLLNELVSYLEAIKEMFQSNPGVTCELTFSMSHIRECRTAFDRMIRRGEENLHRLCELCCHSLLGPYDLESFVVGEVPGSRERFSLTQKIHRDDLYSTSDLDLGTRQLQKLRYLQNEQWIAPTLVANMVEYQPTEPNAYSIYKMISRIKAEEELWNKVVDEIFNLDALVKRDKEIRHLSRYVKDVFGIKLVVGSPQEMRKVQHALQTVRWTAEDLRRVGAYADDKSAEKLRYLEVKAYSVDNGKESGWMAIKSVVMWRGGVFEIQIQPLLNFWKEREFLMRESHAGFKAQREQVREHVAKQIPLFDFYNRLLKWMFQDINGAVPSFPGISVTCVE